MNEVRGDLVAALKRLYEKVETTGLADPAPVMQSFLAETNDDEEALESSIITVVDARHIHRG